MTSVKSNSRSNLDGMSDIIFPAVVAIFAAYVVVDSFRIDWRSGLFSGVGAGALFVVATVLAVREWKSRRKKAADAQVAENPIQRAEPRERNSPLRPILWFVGYLVVMLFVGVPLATLIWAAAYLAYNRAGWLPLITIPITLFLAIEVLITRVLGFATYSGILFGDQIPRF